MIKIEQLTKYYGDSRALHNVSLTVETGEIMGFLGPNGAGKTTTMKILTGYMPATSGRASVNGVDVQSQPLEARQLVGYLPENNPLYLDFTVEEALRYVASVYHIPSTEVKEHIHRVVEQCGLESVYYKSSDTLSKGFRQRVGLAQALISDPKILVLDEPTVGLDPKQIIEIRELVRALGKDRTVLLSTHIMQEVQAICDRVTIINRGEVVASGTPEELKQQSKEQPLASVYVKIAGTIKSVEAALSKIDGVESVEKTDQEKKNIYGYTVRVKPGADVRAEIFALAADKGWKLYELTPTKVSLEDVFLEVTR